VNLREMLTLKTPTVAVVIGEGGSGGALGIAVADRVLMLENDLLLRDFPGGLRRDPLEAPQARPRGGRRTETDGARSFRDEANRRRGAGTARRRASGSRRGHRQSKSAISRQLDELTKISTDELLTKRYEKFRRVGEFTNDV